MVIQYIRSDKIVTSTFKQVKSSLLKEGFDPSKLMASLYNEFVDNYI